MQTNLSALKDMSLVQSYGPHRLATTSEWPVAMRWTAPTVWTFIVPALEITLVPERSQLELPLVK
jgi:hypothetical protein